MSYIFLISDGSRGRRGHAFSMLAGSCIVDNGDHIAINRDHHAALF
jgi:hypothetical protein